MHARSAVNLSAADRDEGETYSLLLTTDGDFRVFRRHGRQLIPELMPPGSSVRAVMIHRSLRNLVRHAG